MGVHKLWDLLTATALPLRVESLFGKVCCIDASFWIIHCLASSANNKRGGDIIAVFFLRICYLLDKGIRPVFVFDGKSPFAKIKTIVKRKLISDKYSTNHKLLAYKLLAEQLKTSSNTNVSMVVNPIPELTNAVEPTEDVDHSEPVEEYQQSSEVDLFELFPEEFLNKTDEELDKDLKIFKESDFLSNKSKYELINAVKDNIIQKDRDKSLQLKGKIDEYSNHQIHSYMRDIKINNEIEQLKNELYQRYPIVQNRMESLNFRNTLADEICDYNEYFSTRFDNNFIALKDDYNNDVKMEEYVENEDKKQVNEEIDDSIFATDDQIFGEELLSGIENVEYNVKRVGDNENKHSKSVSDNVPNKVTNDLGFKSADYDHDSRSDKAMTSGAINDFFLNLYREYLLNHSNAHSENELGQSEKICSDDEDDDGHTRKETISKMVDEAKGTNDSANEGEKEDVVQKLRALARVDEESSEEDEQRLDDYDEEDEVFISKKGDTITQPEQIDNLKFGQNRLYYEDTQALLELFGVPYIIAPSEAESQCAYMNMIGDSYAVISDDSDSLVFGAKCLLKNFYNDNVFELYTSDRILKAFGIGREQLALIAIICGCDYTNGVRGIGIVNALEVIKAYPNFDDLYEFRHWATSDCSIESATSDECPLRSAYKKAHINYRVHWTFSSDFPNREAYDLFLNPTVTDEYNLIWRKPEYDPLLEFMAKKSSLPHEHAQQCVDMLYIKRSQQFIMEDVLPEITSKKVEKKSLVSHRKSLKTNLSAFRKVLLNIYSRSKFNINTKLMIDRSHTFSKIRSKRMVDSLITIKKRYIKNKN